MHAQMGSLDAKYYLLPEGEEGAVFSQEDLQLLNDNLVYLHKKSKDFQAELVAERTKDTPPDKQNFFQPGDFVLWRRNPDEPLPTKLSPKYVGPYVVISQTKNDVACRHIILGHVKDFHVSRLKFFHGTEEEAKRAAMIDNDQYVIKKIHSYRGDPLKRTTMSFLIEYEDNTLVWIRYNKDLDASLPYEDFCRSKPELYPCIFTVEESKRLESEMNSQPITLAEPGDSIFVDLRFFGHIWYDETLDLPNKDEMLYLVPASYYMWENKKHTCISVKFPLFNQVLRVKNDFVKRYGFRSQLPSTNCTLLTRAIIDSNETLKELVVSNRSRRS